MSESLRQLETQLKSAMAVAIQDQIINLEEGERIKQLYDSLGNEGLAGLKAQEAARLQMYCSQMTLTKALKEKKYVLFGEISVHRDLSEDHKCKKVPDLSLAQIAGPREEETANPESSVGTAMAANPVDNTTSIPSTGLRFSTDRVEFFPPIQVPKQYKTIWPTPMFTISMGDPPKQQDREIAIEVDLETKIDHAKKLLFTQNKPSEARQLALEILKVLPTDGWALSIVALSYVVEGNLDKAESAFLHFKSTSPSAWQLPRAYGFFEFARGNFKKAIPYLSAWQKQYPEDSDPVYILSVAHRYAGNHSKALSLLASFEPQTVEDKTRWAVAYRLAGLIDKAVEILRSVVEIQPDNVNALAMLGLVTTEAGRAKEAEPFIKKALELEPDNIMVLGAKVLNYWYTNFQNPDTQFLIPILEKLVAYVDERSGVIIKNTSLYFSFGPRNITFLPPVPWLWGALAACYVKANMWQDAELLLEEIFAKDLGLPSPLDSGALYSALFHVKCKLGKYEEAKKLLQQALRSRIDQEWFLSTYLGAVNDTAKTLDKEEQSYLSQLKALSKTSKNALVFFVLGTISVNEKHLEEALGYYQRAQKLDPENSSVLSALSIIYFATGKEKQGLEMANRAMQAGSITDPTAYKFLLTYHVSRLDFQEVDRVAELALKAHPNDLSLTHHLCLSYMNMIEQLIAEQGFAPYDDNATIKKYLMHAEQCIDRYYANNNRPWFELGPRRLWLQYLSGNAAVGEVEKFIKNEIAKTCVMLFHLALAGNKNEALTLVDNAIKACLPDLVLSASYLNILVNRGQADVAVEIFKRYWADPNADKSQLEKNFGRIFTNAHPESAKILVALVHEAVAEQNYFGSKLVEATRHYDAAVKLDPTLQEAWLGLYRSYKARGMKDKAAITLKELEARF